MIDQANHLRELVRASQAAESGGATASPFLLAVAGGKGGVGTTTVATHLAVALAELGERTALVDADTARGDVAALCGLDDCATVADVVEGRASLAQAWQRGPAGIHVLAGAWAAKERTRWTGSAQRRFLTTLRGLQCEIDYVLLDVGAGTGSVEEQFWNEADAVAVVTTTDSVSIMDAYAAIKQLLAPEAAPATLTIVNRAADSAAALDVHMRLARAAKRFLGREVEALGSIGEYDTPPSPRPSPARGEGVVVAHRSFPQGEGAAAVASMTTEMHRAAARLVAIASTESTFVTHSRA